MSRAQNPVISGTASVTATVGLPFAYDITASNTPTSFSAMGLPTGLTIDPYTGVVWGTPTAAGTSTINLTATNSSGSGAAKLTVTTSAQPFYPVITSGVTAAARVGVPFKFYISASNTPTGYAATGLPAGLSFDPAHGVISGSPTIIGTSTVTLSATNASGTGTSTLVINVTNEMAKAADVGWLQQMDATGFQFYDTTGTQLDPDQTINCLKILKERNISLIRLRVFVPPQPTDWNDIVNGNCNVREVVGVAQKATALGIRVSIDLECSWSFAQPGGQNIPMPWVTAANQAMANSPAGETANQAGTQSLISSLATHITDVLTELKAAGVTPEFIQIGNEITDGILMQDDYVNVPYGGVTSAQTAQIINGGYKAVKAIDPNIKVVIHIDRAHNDSLDKGFYTSLQENGGMWDVSGTDTDGGTFTDIATTMNDLATSFTQVYDPVNKVPGQGGDGVMMCEMEPPGIYNGQGTLNTIPNFDFVTGILDLMRNVPNHKGVGAIYWEPEADHDWDAGWPQSAFANGEPTAALDSMVPSILQASGTNIIGGDGKPLQLKGVNLGGWLLMEPGMTPADTSGLPDEYSIVQELDTRFGVVNEQALVQTYRSNWITTQDLDNIKAQGLNVVRVPVWWGDFYNLSALGTTNPTMRTDAFTNLDWLVQAAAERGIYTIIDMHGVFGGQSASENTGYANQNQYWTNTTDQADTVAMWTQIANHYRGYAWVAGYDLLNEPSGAPDNPAGPNQSSSLNSAVITQLSSLYSAVRAADPDHIIFMQGNPPGWGALPDPSSISPVKPVPWTNVVYEMHEYEPDSPTPTSVENGAAAQVTDFNQHAAYNVPGYIGEFNAFGTGPAAWQAVVNDFNNANMSWSSWAYKSTATSGKDAWSFYEATGALPPIPDIATDTYSTISSNWSQWSTSNTFSLNPMINGAIIGPPEITSPAEATANGGSPFTFAVTATGQPTTYSASGLPSGLSINSSTGVISGAVNYVLSNPNGPPTVYNVTVGATTSGGSCSGNLRLRVYPEGPILIGTNALTVTVGVPFGMYFHAMTELDGLGAYNLPPGLSVTVPDNALIAGTPTTAGTWTATLYGGNDHGAQGPAFTLVFTVLPASTGTGGTPPSSPIITGVLTATGATGVPFTYDVAASNGPTAYTAASLPSGLTINSSSGVISGTPTASGTRSVTLTATNAAGSGTAILQLSINPSTPVITSATTENAVAGISFSYAITASNAPTTYSATGLPVGLYLNSSKGVISGSVATPGTYTIDLSAQNAAGVGTGVLTLTASLYTPTQKPVITSAVLGSGTVGAPFSYTVTATNNPTNYDATGLPSGLSISTSTGIISGTPATAATSVVTINATNAVGTGSGSLTLTVDLPGPPVISSSSTASGKVGSAFSYTTKASNNPTTYNATGLPSGLSVDTSTGVVSGTPTVVGNSPVTLTATNPGGSGTKLLSLTINPPTPVISSAATASGAVGTAFTYTIKASNNPTSFTATGLSTGLGLNTTTGVISGTPTTSGTSTVTLGATNAGGTGTETLTLTVASTPSAPVISSASTANGTVATAFSYTITASNNPTKFNATGLPSPLSLNTTTGVISGTPTAAGTSTVTLGATNAGGTGTKTLTLTIGFTPSAPVISSAATASGTVGTGFIYTITGSSNPTSFNASGLPTGLSISTTTGVISGTPTVTGTSTVTLGATNAGGTGTKTLTLTVNPPVPVITSAATASGTVGVALTYTIMASNNPISFNASGLPTGLSISTTTGVISGTPTVTGTSTVTLGATNAGGTGTKTLTLTVNPPVPVITSAATASGTVGVALTYTIMASNNPISFNASGLPTGLSISTTTGVISGTPTVTGTSTVTLGATNAGGTGTKTLTLTVNLPVPVIGSAATVSGTVGAALTYTITATNTPTSFTASGLPTGLGLNTTTGVISGTPTVTGTSTVTLSATNAGGTGTKTLTLTVNPPVPVIASAATASGTVGAAFTYAITANNTPTSFNATGLPSGLSISTTTGVISGTPTVTGTSTVTLGATNAGGTGTKTLTLTVNPPVPVIGSAATASGTVGAALTYTITATNTPTSFNATGLPTGLGLNTTTGVILGTPTVTGTSTVTLGATNAGGTGTKTLTLTVNPPVPVIGSAATASGTVGTAFTYTITASNNPTSFTASGLPSGLGVNTTTGVISGTPTVTGTSTVTLGATNAGGTGTKTLTLTVNPPVPVIGSAATASGTVGTAFTYTITASNNPTSFTASGLPSGLGVNTTTGVISGTPTVTGTSTVTLGATNAGGTGTKTLTLTVNPPVPVIGSAATASGTVGTAFTYTITASNNPTSFTASGLPSGLGVNTTTGVISGTPTVTGTSTVTLGATNAGGTGTKTLTLTVNPPVPVIGSAATASGTVGAALTYTITATNTPTSFTASGLPTGLSISTTTGVISGTPTATGTSTVTLGATNAGGTGTKTLTLTVNPPVPVIGSAATASGTVGAALTYTITATNTPTSFTASGLPTGLSISTTTGVISGTPTATGTSTVTLGATNAGGTGTKTLTLTVNPPVPVIGSAATASGTVGAALTYTIMASNNPTSFTASGLPTGLGLNTTTGVISGTPTVTGTSTVTLGATNAGGTGTKTLTLTVNPPVPVISSAATASGTVGAALTYTITATNNPTSFNASGLPTGLSISTTTGVISGTPTATGTSTVTLGATSAGGTGTKTLTLTVSPSGYALWIASFGIDGVNALPSATPFDDGMPNLLKYVFGINPNSPMNAADRAALPRVGMEQATPSSPIYLTLTFGQSKAATGLPVVQISSDLQTWAYPTYSAGVPKVTQNLSEYSEQSTGEMDPNGDPYLMIKVPVSGAKEFIRLSIPN